MSLAAIIFMLREKSKKDFYTQKAKKEGYPARSVYKLREINNKYALFKQGDRVLDLGCAPGSWLSYISEKIGQTGMVLGIDSSDIKIPIPSNALFLKKDIFDLQDEDIIRFSSKYNVIVSDLAPKTSGIKIIDEGKSLALCRKAWDMTQEFLEPGGNFFCKIFEGGSTQRFFLQIENNFKFARRIRPKATRKESKEIYIIALQFSNSGV